MIVLKYSLVVSREEVEKAYEGVSAYILEKLTDRIRPQVERHFGGKLTGYGLELVVRFMTDIDISFDVVKDEFTVKAEIHLPINRPLEFHLPKESNV